MTEINDAMQMASSEQNLPVIRKASQFDVKYPSNPNLSQKENDRIRNAVRNEGIAVGSKTFISENGLKELLKTDKKGALIVINNAPKKEVKIYGGKDYLSTPETQKEIAKREEQARPQLDREYLATSSKALDAFSRNPQLEKERTIQFERASKDRDKIGSEIIKQRKPKVSEVTGAYLEDTEEGRPVVHHIERVADNPEKIKDNQNLVIMRNDEHNEFHTDPTLPPNEEGLEKYKKKKMNVNAPR